jgi:hypothetical protein
MPLVPWPPGYWERRFGLHDITDGLSIEVRRRGGEWASYVGYVLWRHGELENVWFEIRWQLSRPCVPQAAFLRQAYPDEAEACRGWMSC